MTRRLRAQGRPSRRHIEAVGLYGAVREKGGVGPTATHTKNSTLTLEPLWRTTPGIAQVAVPVAVPLPPRLLVHVTRVTPTLSEVVPFKVIGEVGLV